MKLYNSTPKLTRHNGKPCDNAQWKESHHELSNLPAKRCPNFEERNQHTRWDWECGGDGNLEHLRKEGGGVFYHGISTSKGVQDLKEQYNAKMIPCFALPSFTCSSPLTDTSWKMKRLRWKFPSSGLGTQLRRISCCSLLMMPSGAVTVHVTLLNSWRICPDNTIHSR